MYAFNFRMPLIFVSLALWGIFSIATVVTVITAFGGDGLNLKSHPRAHL